ncbi:CD99 antigen-like protein 2 isoform X2 [Boleophthalmus pectinirostris]|uniref:CD99 antigen-like protein 2 isoform X2 n=1 Tax=Boleophthalmus pectinirostris TaxID=150288 RepID=UPI00242DC8D2|nr:CD99 antigen-like protein 2 isoform X2 [Boleophthalmus pectinirostris]
MFPRSALSLCAVLALLLPLQVISQELDLSDALDPVTPTAKPATPALPAGGAGKEGVDLSLDDAVDATTTTKAPPKMAPKAPASTKAPVKPKPNTNPAAPDDFDLADALDPSNDNTGKDKKRVQGGDFSDDDLADVGKDSSYKPDKGKGAKPSDPDHIDQYDDNSDTTAEVGTIAGIVSAVAMALVGAISSYISFQKKKLCFSIQQSLNAEMVKSENPDAVVATEPQVQQTLLESANAEPPAEENAV